MNEPEDDREPPPYVPPPSSFTVAGTSKPLLYLPDGRVLVRKIGFNGTREKERE